MGNSTYILKPEYDFESDTSSILLNKLPATICINDTSYAVLCEVRLDLTPRARIHLYGHFNGIQPVDAVIVHTNPGTNINFNINGHDIKGFRIDSYGYKDNGIFCIKWCPVTEPIRVIGNDKTLLETVVFHLFNFVEFRGSAQDSVCHGSDLQLIECIYLNCKEWEIEIKSLFSTSKNTKYLKEEGGYRLTHIGCIKKPDGTLFSSEDANKCLEALCFALSFAKGGWCDPVCPVGYNMDGDRVWESWYSPRESWKYTNSWFDRYSGTQLESLFSCLMNKWTSPDWRDTLANVIYWYINSNTSNQCIESGIIMTQAAIERLSYQFSVDEKQLVTGAGFEKLWASDKFRLLFSSLQVPIIIPKENKKLLELAKAMKWIDAPYLLTEIRNTIVHPNKKKQKEISTAYYEAWNLGLWYMEMCILGVCGYDGTYGNRLKQRYVGQVENVPWK